MTDQTDLRKVWYVRCDCGEHLHVGGKKRKDLAVKCILAAGWVLTRRGWICPDCVQVPDVGNESAVQP